MESTVSFVRTSLFLISSGDIEYIIPMCIKMREITWAVQSFVLTLLSISIHVSVRRRSTHITHIYKVFMGPDEMSVWVLQGAQTCKCRVVLLLWGLSNARIEFDFALNVDHFPLFMTLFTAYECDVWRQAAATLSGGSGIVPYVKYVQQSKQHRHDAVIYAVCLTMYLSWDAWDID